MKITKAEYYWYIWVIDQACSVKMARYWPSSFFACLWTEKESRNKTGNKAGNKIKSTRFFFSQP